MRIGEVASQAGVNIDTKRELELKVNLWTLKHLCFYFTLPLPKLLADVLPDKLSLLAGRTEKARELLAQLDK